MGRAEIEIEMDKAQTNLLRFKSRVRDKNEKEQKESD
jgi:hypothetical protein